MILPPPISTLFPYTTLFRSLSVSGGLAGLAQAGRAQPDRRCVFTRSAAEDLRSAAAAGTWSGDLRSEEHTSEPSHGYISYAVFCLKKKNNNVLKQLR